MKFRKNLTLNARARKVSMLLIIQIIDAFSTGLWNMLGIILCNAIISRTGINYRRAVLHMVPTTKFITTMLFVKIKKKFTTHLHIAHHLRLIMFHAPLITLYLISL